MLLLLLAGSLPASAASPLALESKHATMNFSGRIQSGYTLQLEREDATGDAQDRFAMGQVRLNLEGEVEEQFAYKLSLDLLSGGGKAEAKDLWMAWEPTRWFTARLGQYKVASSRHRLASDGKLLFIERSVMSEVLITGRDVGLEVQLHPFPRTLSLTGGIFTGQGPNQQLDDPRGLPLLAGRIEWIALGTLRRGEGDLERTPAPALGLGLFGTWSRDETPQEGGEGRLYTIDGDKILWGGDATFKYRGLFASVELALALFEPAHDKSFDAAGLSAQAGWYLAALRLEPAVRYDHLNPSDLVQQDMERVLTAGLNFYPLARRRVRIQANYMKKYPEKGGEKAPWAQDELVVQAQLIVQ